MKINKHDVETEEVIESIEFIDGSKVYYRLVGGDIYSKYEELLMAVTSKNPIEGRHETALRYIKEAEQRQGNSGSQKL